MTDTCSRQTLTGSNRAVLWVRYLELADKTGDLDRSNRAIAALRGQLNSVPDHMFLRLLRLCKHLSDGAFAAEVLTACFARSRMDGKLATECLNWACTTLGHQQAQGVEHRVLSKMDPASRQGFALTALRLLHGPEDAYRAARSGYPRTRHAQEAVLLARALSDTGRTTLSARYLRRVARRWPLDMTLQDAMFRAFLNSGDVARARDLLTALAPYLSDTQWRSRSLDLLKGEGRYKDAWPQHQALERDDARYATSFECLRMNVFFGEIAEFRRLAYEVMAKHRHHLRATFLGSVVDEKRIYAAQQPEGGEITRHDVASYYHPAAEITRRLPQMNPDTVTGQGTPVRQIHQYWDKAAVPEMVDQIMQSWQGIYGWSYQRFTRKTALTWLARTYGRDHARAFRMVRREAEQADFLRLCLLDAQGGLYVDADDRLTGSPDALLSGAPGAVFFCEAFGCLSNNVIYAPPGHVVIQTAREMACEALLRRDNDKVWLKTGPGLLTRALALCAMDGLLCEGHTDPTKSVTIRSNAALKQHVAPHIPLPYKQTDQNWAHSDTPVAPEVKAAWAQLLA